jgi:hypothetical protein
MSYTSGDWTARQRYLLSSKLCFPQEDANALLEFINGTQNVRSDTNGLPYCYTAPMPFFPIYNGPQASMAFGSASNLDLSGSSATLCSVTLMTDISGKLAIWGTVDASGAPFTIELVLNGTVVAQISTSPYIFFGTAAVMLNGNYTANLRCSTSGFLKIAHASIMMVGELT